MSQPEKKLDKFSSAVLKDAEAQRERILAEIEDYRKAEMEKAEEDILHEAYIMIQNEIATIKNQQSRRISLSELEGRRKFLKQREDIMARVFQETFTRILEFTHTAEYQNKLCDAVKKSCDAMPEGDIVIQVKRDDLTFGDKLAAASGRSAKVQASSSITLGGYILINKGKGVIIDESLDLKLSKQKDWFAASSGLTMGL